MTDRKLFRITAGVLSAGIIAALGLTGCSSGGGDQSDAGASNLTIMVSPSVYSASIQVGYDQGFFERENVDVEVVSSAGGAATVTALTAGAVDIGGAPPQLLIPAIELGAPIKLMMNAYEMDITLVAKPGIIDADAEFPENMKNTKGLRVGLSARGGVAEQVIAGSLEAAGMGPDDVAYVAIGAGQSAVEAFKNDQVDAAALIAPEPVYLSESDYEVIATPDEILDIALSSDYMYSAWSVGGAAVETKSEAVIGFCRAMDQSIDYIRDPANKDSVVDSFVTWMSLTPEVAEDVYDMYAENFTTAVDEARWNGQAAYVASGEIPLFEDSIVPECVEIANS